MKTDLALLLGIQAVPEVVGARLVNPMGEDESDIPIGNRGDLWKPTPDRLANLERGRALGHVDRAAQCMNLWECRVSAIKDVIRPSRELIASQIAFRTGLEGRLVRMLLNKMRAEKMVDFRLVPANSGGPGVRSWFLVEKNDEPHREN